MIDLPKDIKASILLNRSLVRLKVSNDPILGWLEEQLATLDRENRTEITDVFKQRQGAAQAISQLLDFINNSKNEVVRLEGAISNERRA